MAGLSVSYYVNGIHDPKEAPKGQERVWNKRGNIKLKRIQTGRDQRFVCQDKDVFQRFFQGTKRSKRKMPKRTTRRRSDRGQDGQDGRGFEASFSSGFFEEESLELVLSEEDEDDIGTGETPGEAKETLPEEAPLSRCLEKLLQEVDSATVLDEKDRPERNAKEGPQEDVTKHEDVQGILKNLFGNEDIQDCKTAQADAPSHGKSLKRSDEPTVKPIRPRRSNRAETLDRFDAGKSLKDVLPKAALDRLARRIGVSRLAAQFVEDFRLTLVEFVRINVKTLVDMELEVVGEKEVEKALLKNGFV